MATSAPGSPSSRSEARRSVASSLELLFTPEQQPAGPIERIVAATPMAKLFDLDAPADGVEGAVGQRDHMEGVDHLGGPGQHDAVDGGIGGRHVEGTKVDALLPGHLGCLSSQAATST